MEKIKDDLKNSVDKLNSPYIKCPTLENEKFKIRMVEECDDVDLLPCYANPNVSVVTNSFNCNMGYGAQSVEKMREYIIGWRRYFDNKTLIRWSVIDKLIEKAIGSIELYCIKREDFFDNYAILRLDLHTDYETKNVISNILTLLINNAFEWFGCDGIATKVSPNAHERIEALSEFGFIATNEYLVVDKEKYYNGFWIFTKK